MEKEVLYLGIDGGATGTDYAIADENDNIIRTLRTSPSNPFDIGMDAACEVLRKGIGEITDGLDRGGITMFAGLSGGKTGGNRERFNEFFSSFGFRHSDCDSDTANAVAVALKGANGVVSIIGTGNSTCVYRDGTLELIGGHGYLFDKGCSAYDLGLSALNEAFRARDGIIPETVLTRLVAVQCGGNPDNIIRELYSNGKALVASFGKLVFEAADEGDERAKEILSDSARSLSAYIMLALERLNKKDRRAVLVGGMTHFEDAIRPLVEEFTGLGSDSLEFCHEKPIYGSLFLAKQLEQSRQNQEYNERNGE